MYNRYDLIITFVSVFMITFALCFSDSFLFFLGGGLFIAGYPMTWFLTRVQYSRRSGEKADKEE